MALRTPLTVSPHMYIGDSTGRPLDLGMVYFGEPDKDPEFYPIPIFSDDSLTIPVSQPVRTKGGYLNDNKGDMAEIHAKELIYSVKVLDQYGRKIFYKGQSMRSNWNDDVIIRIDEAIINSTAKAQEIARDAVDAAIEHSTVDGSLVTDALIKTVPKITMLARSQKAKNDESVSPLDFGATSDGTYHPVSDWTVAGSRVYFANLAEIQAKFPHVTSLTDSIDWVALQAFFNFCHVNFAVRADATINGYINKPVDFLGFEHATNTIYGKLELKTDEPLDYMLWITGQRFQFLGTIRLRGAVSDIPKNRVTRQGLILGSPTEPAVGYMANAYIAAVDCSYFLDAAVNWSNYCHFSEIGLLRTTNIGSTGDHVATISAVSHIGGDVNQASVLTVNDLPPQGLKNGYSLVSVGGKLYKLISVDRALSTIKIYPQLPSGVASGEVKYIYGHGLYTEGSDSSNKRVSQCQHILTGIGLSIQTLYGLSVGNLTTEFNGAGLLLSNISDASIGSLIESGYFEANKFDIVGGAFPENNNINILQTAGLDLDKCVALYKYRDYTGGLIKGNLFGGSVNIDGKTYSGQENFSANIAQQKTINFRDVYDSNTIQLAYNSVELEHFASPETVYVLSGVSGVSLNGDVVFLPPVGATINGQPNFTVHKADYDGSAIVVVRVLSPTYISASVVTPKIARKDTTGSRPNNPSVGQMYLDTTLTAAGKPIWWTGSSWVDALGASA